MLASCERLQTCIFCVKHSVDVILMICWWPFTVHLLVVVEEVGVHLVQEPLLPSYCHLHGDEEWAGYPVDESSGWPLIREWKMKELERLEEWTKSIHKPVFVLLGNTSLHCIERVKDVRMITYTKVEVVERCCYERQEKVRVRFIQIREPKHSSSSQIFGLKGYLSNGEHHDDEDWDLDDVVEVERW